MSDKKSHEGLPGDDVFRVPSNTAPTWEVELLISAASFFSLLALPATLDSSFLHARAHFDASFTLFVSLAFLYAKVINYALVLTFALHLILRAAWIATLGLRSVFASGIQWDKLRSGPVYREYARSHDIRLEAAVERADNAASVVFAFGILVALMSLLIMFASLLMATVSGIAAWLWFDGETPGWFVAGLAALVAVPGLAAAFIDRFFGQRLRPGGLIFRAVQRVYQTMHWVGGGGIVNPLMLTISSQAGALRFGIVFGAILYATMAVVSVQMLTMTGRIDLGVGRALPKTEGNELRSANYATTRSASERYSIAPYIQAEVLEGPYLRLHVPFDRDRLDTAMRQHCPELDSNNASEDTAAVDAQALEYLRCVAEVYEPAVNGQVVADLRFDIATDSATRLRGFLSHIDVRNLPSGRHVLSLKRLADAQPDDANASDDDEPEPLIKIPFYR